MIFLGDMKFCLVINDYLCGEFKLKLMKVIIV